MTDAPPSGAFALARQVLAVSPAGLLTDLDGTLSPIVRDPFAARLADGAADALARLVQRLAVVGVVTGRAAGEARRIVGVPGLLVVGNHGTEWLLPGAADPEPTPQLNEVAARLDAVLAALPDEPGMTIQHKGLSATVHYRNSADPKAARQHILTALGHAARDGIELRHGRMSVELRPTGLGDKGTAVRAVVERYRLRGLIVAGDDVTDLDMFRASARMRDEGLVRAAIIAVGGGDEVPPEVGGAADAVVADPAALAGLLAALADEA